MRPTIHVTYTGVARLAPPQRGDIVRFGHLGDDALYRVTNDPRPDLAGMFTIEIEPVIADWTDR